MLLLAGNIPGGAPGGAGGAAPPDSQLQPTRNGQVDFRDTKKTPAGTGVFLFEP
ncbi:hypothetical protein SAMN04488026_100676 [Aliiruegeria lutimaris]|uniref:Uncharacterized protein n=1 Tax=Aliiruegeria lutimaris TaxID=571298 RepID=A0A1G8MWM2_9RHOB|nr:hypothetical protein SAMN04488026_100676 [Aliiruegeria lutimaris]